MPKIEFQERGTATVKVRGQDQASLATASSGVGPQGFPPPPSPPPPPPPSLTIAATTASIDDGFFTVSLSRNALLGIAPTGWTLTGSGALSCSSWAFDTEDTIIVQTSGPLVGDEVLVVSGGDHGCVAKNDFGTIPAGSHPLF